MALFFRGKARKFFLILLTRRRSEKDCTGFAAELREFCRRPVGGSRRMPRRAGALQRSRGEAAAAAAVAEAAARARKAAWQGFAPRIASVLTHEMHSVRIGCGRWISTTPGCGRALTGRLHSVSSVAGGVDYPQRGQPAHPADRGAHHSNPQGCESVRRPDIHTRLPASRRRGGDAHRSNAQDCESIERGAISRSGVRLAMLYSAGAAPAEACRRGAPRAQPHTENPVSFDGEQRHASE